MLTWRAAASPCWRWGSRQRPRGPCPGPGRGRAGSPWAGSRAACRTYTPFTHVDTAWNIWEGGSEIRSHKFNHAWTANTQVRPHPDCKYVWLAALSPCRAPIGQLSPLPCLFTSPSCWGTHFLHLCEPPSHYSLPCPLLTSRWWRPLLSGSRCRSESRTQQPSHHRQPATNPFIRNTYIFI